MIYYVFATLFAQLVITLRLATPSVYLIPTSNHTIRVYAVTGKNRRIAACLYFISFVQAAIGIGTSVYFVLHPGTVTLLSLRGKPLRQNLKRRKQW